MKEKLPKYIILYTTSFGYMAGGGQWSLYYLIKHLNKDLFHPILLCPERGELSEKMRSVGAEVLFLNLGRIRHFNPLILWKFISIIRNCRVDIVHTDSSTETFYAGMSARIVGTPLVWHIRTSKGEWFLDRILASFSKRLILVAKALNQRFDWLNNTGKLVVIYNGIDLEEFDKSPTDRSIRRELSINKDTVVLGCIGRIEERKGQKDIVSAIRNLDNVKLILVGRGEEGYLKRIKTLCEQFGVSDRVIPIGYRDDIPSLLKEIDILVFPTKSGEGFSRVILEAMAAGKPVVATDHAGNPEAVVDNLTGYIIPTGDSSALAAKIKEFVANKKMGRTMGQAGRKRVEELFTIQQNVQRIEEVYNDVLKRRTLKQ
jgi:glycosyltransferase involved in cell wall biosynthesis